MSDNTQNAPLQIAKRFVAFVIEEADVVGDHYSPMLRDCIEDNREWIEAKLADLVATIEGKDQMKQHECPVGENALVWKASCALASKRHPNASYPQPKDVEDARVVIVAVASELESRIGDITAKMKAHILLS